MSVQRTITDTNYHAASYLSQKIQHEYLQRAIPKILIWVNKKARIFNHMAQTVKLKIQKKPAIY